MNYSDYKYIDTAFGGADKRNNIKVLSSRTKFPAQTSDCFSTMFRFGRDYANHFKKSGSVRGAKVSCWSDYLWFDIDNDDLTVSLSDTRDLVAYLKSQNVDLAYVVVFFSGSKGFHIGIDSGLFGLEPSIDLPGQMKQIAENIASECDVSIDHRIYNHNRLWRLPNSVHGKTHLRKTQLDPAQLDSFTVKKIEQLARQNSDRPYYAMTDIVAGSIEPLANLISPSPLPGSKSAGDISVDKKTGCNETGWFICSGFAIDVGHVQRRLAKLLEMPITRGSRDNEAILRASECRKVGYDEDETLDLLLEWNELNEPPLTDRDITRIVQSAYTGDGYDFGTKSHESLREADDSVRADNGDNDGVTVRLSDLPDNIKKRFKIKGNKEFVLRGVLWQDFDKSQIRQVESFTPFEISMHQRLNLLFGEDKAGKGTLITSEIKWLLENTDYKILVFNSDEPMADFGSRNDCAGIPKTDRLRILSHPHSFEEMVAETYHFKPNLIVFDSLNAILQDITGIPEFSDEDGWRGAIRNFEMIMEMCQFNDPDRKYAGVILHHETKSSVDKNGYKKHGTYRGSGNIGAAVSYKIQLKTNRVTKISTLNYIGRLDGPVNKDLRYIGSYLYEVIGASDDNETLKYSDAQLRIIHALPRHGHWFKRLDLEQSAGVEYRTLDRFCKKFDIKNKMTKGVVFLKVPTDLIQQFVDEEIIFPTQNIDESE